MSTSSKTFTTEDILNREQGRTGLTEPFLPSVAPKNLRAYAGWFDGGKLIVGPELCFHPNVFSSTLRDYADGIEAEKKLRDDILGALRATRTLLLEIERLGDAGLVSDNPDVMLLSVQAIAKAERAQ